MSGQLKAYEVTSAVDGRGPLLPPSSCLKCNQLSTDYIITICDHIMCVNCSPDGSQCACGSDNAFFSLNYLKGLTYRRIILNFFPQLGVHDEVYQRHLQQGIKFWIKAIEDGEYFPGIQYFDLADSYYRLNDYSNAAKYALIGLKHHDCLGDEIIEKMKFKNAHFLGVINGHLHEYKKAVEYFKQSMVIIDKYYANPQDRCQDLKDYYTNCEEGIQGNLTCLTAEKKELKFKQTYFEEGSRIEVLFPNQEYWRPGRVIANDFKPGSKAPQVSTKDRCYLLIMIDRCLCSSYCHCPETRIVIPPNHARNFRSRSIPAAVAEQRKQAYLFTYKNVSYDSIFQEVLDDKPWIERQFTRLLMLFMQDVLPRVRWVKGELMDRSAAMLAKHFVHFCCPTTLSLSELQSIVDAQQELDEGKIDVCKAQWYLYLYNHNSLGNAQLVKNKPYAWDLVNEATKSFSNHPAACVQVAIEFFRIILSARRAEDDNVSFIPTHFKQAGLKRMSIHVALKEEDRLHAYFQTVWRFIDAALECNFYCDFYRRKN